MSKVQADESELALPEQDASLFHTLNGVSPEEYAAKEKKLVRKIDLKLMPILFLIIILK